MAEELKLVVLDSKEKARFDELCGVVDRGIKTFFEVGMALAEIKDKQLYRETHGTFEEFCYDKWDIHRRHAYRLIDGAMVVTNVSHGTQNLAVPTNERQARPLTEFEADLQRELWGLVLERSYENDGKITAALVSSVVAEYLRKQTKDGLEKTRTSMSREAVIAPVFKERFQALLDVVSDEVNTGFKNTSRVAVLNHLDAVRDLVARAKG